MKESIKSSKEYLHKDIEVLSRIRSGLKENNIKLIRFQPDAEKTTPYFMLQVAPWTRAKAITGDIIARVKIHAIEVLDEHINNLKQELNEHI